MCLFGLELTGTQDQHSELPLARILLGNSVEIVALDTSAWAADRYVEHWQETAKHLLKATEGSYHLFTSSLLPSGAVIWPASRKGKEVIIGNMVVPMTDICVEDLVVRPSEEFLFFLQSSETLGSSWAVPTEYIRCFAEV